MSSTDLVALHDAIRASAAAHFPSAHVGYYERPFEKCPKSPSIFLHLGEIQPADPQTNGDDSFEAVLHWSAFVVVRFRDANAKQNLRVTAAELLRWIRGQRWGQVVGPAVVSGAFPDEMNPSDDGYEVFRVDWTHEARFCAPPATIPPVTEVLSAFAPTIGPIHESAYTAVLPEN